MMKVFDAHCDAPSQMLRLRDFGLDNARGQVDFPKMKRGGVGASFFAAYVPASLSGKAATDYAGRLLDETRRQVLANPDKAALATSASGAQNIVRSGLVAVMLGIENASALDGGNPFELLKSFYKRGVRYITLTHSADNAYADSCTGSGRWGGLSPLGKQLIVEMNRIGMMIDLAHASDGTIRDVLSLSSAPVAYTHGCCRALASHRRNISDELMKGIAGTGGVVCMSIYPCFLDDGFVKILGKSGLEEKSYIEDEFIRDPSNPEKREAWYSLLDELAALPRPSVARVVDHIEHAVSVVGVEHVGIGTDYDGIEVTAMGLEDVSGFGLVTDEMKRRGFSRSDISKIAGGNLLRVLKEVRKSAKIRI